MAQEVSIGGGATAKIRNVVAVAILSIVTIFIYVFFWWYFVNREMADFGKERSAPELGDSPAKSTLAITLGSLVIVPAVWTTVTTFKRIQAAQRLTGQPPINGWIGLILAVVITPALYAYMQSGLNSAWKSLAPAEAEGPATV